jgi:hypothetical protein
MAVRFTSVCVSLVTVWIQGILTLWPSVASSPTDVLRAQSLSSLTSVQLVRGSRSIFVSYLTYQVLLPLPTMNKILCHNIPFLCLNSNCMLIPERYFGLMTSLSVPISRRQICVLAVGHPINRMQTPYYKDTISYFSIRQLSTCPVA